MLRRRPPAAAPRIDRTQVGVHLLRSGGTLASHRETLLERGGRLFDAELVHKHPAERGPCRQLLGQLHGCPVRLDGRLDASARPVQRRKVDVCVVGRRVGYAEGFVVALLRSRPFIYMEQAPPDIVVQHVLLECRGGRRELEDVLVQHECRLPLAVCLLSIGYR